MMFSKHTGMVANKANRILGVIRRTFDYMDAVMFTTLYKSLIRPHLEYTNCIWSPILHKDSTLIESIQRKATKLVQGLKDLPYPVRLRYLKIPALAYRRVRGDMIQVYKIMHGLVGTKKETLFTMVGPERGTRGNTSDLARI